MTDIAERLRGRIAADHRRLCQGTWIPRKTKQYSCTCGYDTRDEDLLVAAADVIERLLQEREGLIPNDPGWLEGLKRR